MPKKQRALVFQGGGALGAYNAGVFQALYDTLPKEDEHNGERGRPLFDIVAGTSSGAMNGAILVSYFIEEGTWNGSADRLNEFWHYVSANPYVQNIPGFNIWWDSWHNLDPVAASEESARRYYSTKEFMLTGVQHVFSSAIARPDTKFFDPLNTWYMYNNQPLKESLEKFAKFPIATSFESGQPRLLITSVDVQESATVTFDSYEKSADGTRKSEYGYHDSKDKYEYTIKYDYGIKSDHAMASGSVPIGYDYSKIDVEKSTLSTTATKRNNKNSSTVPHYFWDGGILSNTPLRELLEAHRNYWFKVKGIKDRVPDLEVYIIDVWPSKEINIPFDYDGVKDRQFDIMLSDKTTYDEKVAYFATDYINLSNKLIGFAKQLAKDNGISEVEFIKRLEEEILSKNAKSSHRTGQPRKYHDMIDGRFKLLDVKRVERKNNTNDISNKLLDYSADTITQLWNEGYNDTLETLK